MNKHSSLFYNQPMCSKVLHVSTDRAYMSRLRHYSQTLDQPGKAFHIHTLQLILQSPEVFQGALLIQALKLLEKLTRLDLTRNACLLQTLQLILQSPDVFHMSPSRKRTTDRRRIPMRATPVGVLLRCSDRTDMGMQNPIIHMNLKKNYWCVLSRFHPSLVSVGKVGSQPAELSPIR